MSPRRPQAALTSLAVVAPLATEGVGVPPFVHLTMDMPTYMDGGSDHASSAFDAKDTTSHVAPTTGALDMPSSTYPLMDIATSYASPVDIVAAPTPLTLTTGMAPAGS